MKAVINKSAFPGDKECCVLGLWQWSVELADHRDVPTWLNFIITHHWCMQTQLKLTWHKSISSCSLKLMFEKSPTAKTHCRCLEHCFCNTWQWPTSVSFLSQHLCDNFVTEVFGHHQSKQARMCWLENLGKQSRTYVVLWRKGGLWRRTVLGHVSIAKGGSHSPRHQSTSNSSSGWSLKKNPELLEPEAKPHIQVESQQALFCNATNFEQGWSQSLSLHVSTSSQTSCPQGTFVSSQNVSSETWLKISWDKRNEGKGERGVFRWRKTNHPTTGRRWHHRVFTYIPGARTTENLSEEQIR